MPAMQSNVPTTARYSHTPPTGSPGTTVLLPITPEVPQKMNVTCYFTQPSTIATALVNAIAAAQSQILVQAYELTLANFAAELVNAQPRT